MVNRRFLIRYAMTGLQLAAVCLTTLTDVGNAGDDKFERGRMEDIMDVVAKDIQKHFYDPNLKGADWKAITEKARQRIRQAEHLGDFYKRYSGLQAQERRACGESRSADG
jgi:hypothetical protein